MTKPWLGLSILVVLALMLVGCGDVQTHPEKEPPRVVPPGQVTLEWEAPTTNSDGSVLEDLKGYKIDIRGETKNSERSISIGNVTRYTVKNLRPGQRYIFRLRALDRMGNESEWSKEVETKVPYPSKINFVDLASPKTSTPKGWVEYDGAPYDPVRGFGWLTNWNRNGRDRGMNAPLELSDGSLVTAQELGRPELANWQGRHQENKTLVFRIDLPNGWYKVTCTSVDPGIKLPLVDQRNFKCRAHDVVFAGPGYGPPLSVKGRYLIEGSGMVEVTDEHLRMVVGDPAYGGWTWEHSGPWYTGWQWWVEFEHTYANGWGQKIRRIVDPGFHSLRLNSLQIEPVRAPPKTSSIIFRDFFNRDNSSDVNLGVAELNKWLATKLDPDHTGDILFDLYQTSIRLKAPRSGSGVMGLLQNRVTPHEGIIQYSTSVSLFTGEGSQKHSGHQEAGILLLADTKEGNEFATTFVGVGFDGSTKSPHGTFIYRVGDGKKAYQMNLEVPDTNLPFMVREGEYQIIVIHDVRENAIVHVRINGVDLTAHIPESDRIQRTSQGYFGLRSKMDRQVSGVELKQFYWYFRVDVL